jgi:hypothetical protein
MELLLFITLSVTVPKDGPFHFGVRQQKPKRRPLESTIYELLFL